MMGPTNILEGNYQFSNQGESPTEFAISLWTISGRKLKFILCLYNHYAIILPLSPPLPHDL